MAVAALQVVAVAGEIERLILQIENAADGLDADRFPQIDPSESEVVSAIDDAIRFLERKTSPENAAAWLKFLDLEPLLDAIQAGAPVSVRGPLAVKLRRRLVGPEVGLELSRLVALRVSLDEYIAALQLGNRERGLSVVGGQLKLMAGKLRPAAGDDDDDDSSDAGAPLASLLDLSPIDASSIETILSLLRHSHQADELVATWVRRFSSPNVVVWVDGNVITRAIMRPVDNSMPVRDCILGTRLIGQSKVTGTVSAALLPQNGYVRLLVRMDGAFSSSTRGYSGPISLDTTGTGRVYVARQLAITQRGVTLGPVVCQAHLSTRIDRINHKLRIVRKIAGKKAAESKPQAESIAQERLRKRVQDGFTEETDRVGGRRFADLDVVMRPWLRRLDIPAPVRDIGSTDALVFATARVQKPAGLAAPGPPPSLANLRENNGLGGINGDFAAVIQVHESVLNNTIAGVLSGSTFQPSDLRKLTESLGLGRLGQDASAETAAQTMSETVENDDESDFEVDFASTRPIYFEARDGRLRIGIRGTRFAQGGSQITANLDVSATYQPAIDDAGKMILIRDADIDLEFPGRRLSMKQTATKASIIEGFSRLFPMTLLTRPLTVPDSVALPAIAGKTYRPVAIDLQDGWFTLAVRERVTTEAGSRIFAGVQ